MKILLNIILVGVFLIHSSAFANCRSVLEDLSVTENLIAYLNALIEKNYIENPNYYMKNLLQDIEQERSLSSPFDPLQESNHLIQESNYQNYINHPELDRNALSLWLTKKLTEMQETTEQKQVNKDKTAVGKVDIRFHKVKPGQVNNRYKQKLTTPFEMMETLVTQNMWFEVMNFNPSRFIAGNDKMLPNHPVIKITWWSAAMFANRLSELRGLKPVYDFSQIKDWVGSPEEGTYKPINIEKPAKLIRINAKNEDVFKAEGYRLPTVEELQLTLQSGEVLEDIRVNDYAWTYHNSDGELKAVAEKLPFIVNGNPFYDLYGNLYNFTHTMQHEDKVKLPKVNPQTDFKNSLTYIYIFGSCYASSHVIFNPNGIMDHLDKTSNTNGFRLVRSLPKEKK